MFDKSEYNKNYVEKRKRVQVSFSPDEFRAIEALAKELDTKPATLVRKLTLATMQGKRVSSPALEEELKGLSFLIRNFASNLNQIAKHSNRVQHVVDENKTLDVLRKFELTLKESVARFGR